MTTTEIAPIPPDEGPKVGEIPKHVIDELQQARDGLKNYDEARFCEELVSDWVGMGSYSSRWYATATRLRREGYSQYIDNWIRTRVEQQPMGRYIAALKQIVAYQVAEDRSVTLQALISGIRFDPAAVYYTDLELADLPDDTDHLKPLHEWPPENRAMLKTMRMTKYGMSITWHDRLPYVRVLAGIQQLELAPPVNHATIKQQQGAQRRGEIHYPPKVAEGAEFTVEESDISIDKFLGEG